MVTLSFVAVILLFFLLDFAVIRRLERATPFTGASSEKDHAPVEREFVMPRGYFFHPGHVWVRVRVDGTASVGIDDLARTALGEIEKVSLPQAGAEIEQGEVVLRLGSGEGELGFVSPLSGKVVAVNEAAISDPNLVVSDPYGAGWLLRIEPISGPCREIALLVIAKAAADWMKGELERLRDLVKSRGGGRPVEGLLSGAPREVWAEFQHSFLDRKAGEEG
ncbi:MAG: glycine cleavage system protein H [Polyangia bacterium]